MATITSGGSATGTFGTADSITINTRGSAKFECPTGTVVAEFSGSRTFGPYTGQTFRVTAVAGPAEYETLDGSGPVFPVSADVATGSLYANGSPVSGDGFRRPAAANAVFTKYGVAAHGGAWGNTCATNATIGVTALAHSLSNERPRFETYTRKCVLSAAASEIRFASANFTADPAEKALSIDVYIEQMPSEFLGGSNPYITVQLSNTTSLGANYSRWVFDSGYIRQGWNTLKMRQADTVSGTSGAGNLPIGCNHPADAGTGFDWTAAGQYIALAFTNMNGFTVHIDQLRRPAKAKAVLTIGFDASGYNATDEVFVTKVAPLFNSAGIKSYCTMTNIYELIYSGSQAWTRVANLYNNHGWDIINHTWSHGATEVGKLLTASSASRTSGVVTFNTAAAHGLPANKIVKLGMQGGSAADANIVADCTVTSATAFTYAAAGADGAITGLKAYSYLSEVINADTAENERLLKHELTDVTRILKANGFSRGAPVVAYPNNSVPHLDVLKRVALDAGIQFGRAYRGGYAFVNELGIDNPLNFGSFVMDSGTNFTRLSTIQAKVQGAIERGEHIHIFGHFILDDEDPANSAYAPVDPDYPPSQNGNPNPPSASLTGFGGWWYMSQLRALIRDTIAPAIRSGQLLAMSPSEYAAYMGGRDN